MDSSSTSRGTTTSLFRSGPSNDLTVSARHVSNSRGGTGVTVFNHYRPNPANDEPRSSDREFSATPMK
ncbi:hypothetical protein C8A05DRAFT_31656 [Staphylotrichum tortipilum]|uniref:Uncharacterized protein n=1 Tax=Staphylotrichum tortipilum TaxID=2831512 RepID=A0AAN6MPA7_9PEZI|nr:hypothetical protein C8A05DRAFT_31656 [Staphylotrichum longicolle]